MSKQRKAHFETLLLHSVLHFWGEAINVYQDVELEDFFSHHACYKGKTAH